MSPSTTLRLGTRKSALALAQSGQVARAIEAAHPDVGVELVPIVTQGDRMPGSLAEIGGKGLFTEELEAGLADGTLDLAVHSLKDLPVTLPEGLVVAAYPERADPRDVLVSDTARHLGELEPGAVLLTGSLRRRAQILRARPDVVVEPIRGNVETRLRRWRERGAAGLILAAAGLGRLGLDDLPAHPLDPTDVIPAPGQGTLALEVRAGGRAEELVAALDDPETRRTAEAERAVVAAFGADCTLPLAAWARETDPEHDGSSPLTLSALLSTPDGDLAARGEATAASPAEVARRVVEAMWTDGAERVLARIGRGGSGSASPAIR